MNKASEKMPVIIGVASIMQKTDDLAAMNEAWQLMRMAVEQSAADACGANDALANKLLASIDEILVPQGFWAYSDPGRLVADAVGATQAQTCLAGIGVLQQAIMNRAFQRIADGEIKLAVVVGGEAKYRALQARIQGVEISDTEQASVHPDYHWTSTDELWSELEASRGLMMPAEFFALMESALATAKGHNIQQHQDYLGELYQGFNQQSQRLDDAWFNEPCSAADIITATDKNPYLAFPYTKKMNAQWNVNQAGAMLICEEGFARELGLINTSGADWIYPCAGTVSEYVVPLSQRPVIYSHAGTKVCASKAFELAGKQLSDIDVFELYSCFPAVVQSHAWDIGVPEGKRLTQTGGMAFYGGPLNNFVIQSTVNMVRELRQPKVGTGLVSCISAINGKQGVCIYQSSKPHKNFASDNVTEQARTMMPACDIDADFEGEAELLAWTVVFNKEGPSHAFVFAQTHDEKRLVCVSRDAQVLKALMEKDHNGQTIKVCRDGNFSLA